MASLQCISSCFAFQRPFPTIKTNNTTTYSQSTHLGFSTTLSENSFSKGCLSIKPIERATRRGVVCEAAPTKKADSAIKRARQAEKRRVYNKSKKSELRTRSKKVLEALEVLQKKTGAESEEILTIEKLIAEAYSAIDKAVKSGALHRNTGANRKSRLARRKKAVEIHHGWYTPDAVAA